MATYNETTQPHIHIVSAIGSLRLCRSAKRFKILKPTSQAFIVSLIVHGVILLILSTFLAANIRPSDESMAVTFLKSSAPPKPKNLKPPMKTVTQPTVPTHSIIVAEPRQHTPRTTIAVNVRAVAMSTEKEITFSNRPLQLDSQPQPHCPRIVDSSQPIPQVVTHVNLPTSDAPSALAFSAFAAGGAGGGGGLVGYSPRRGGNGVPEGIRLKPSPPTVGLQSFIGTTAATPSALESVINGIQLGNELVPPMRPNELGACIYTDPRTGLPTGHIQICYVRFRQRDVNSLLYLDPTALPYLMRWMYDHTGIKGRIVGRAPYIDDPEILQSPMLYLNGGSAIRLRPEVKQNLTRYLVEKRGFIFVDDEMENGRPARFAHSMRSQFREIILLAGGRELQQIPNDHPIWNQPFRLGGQPPNPNHEAGPAFPMTAFELDGRLAVVISYNDYNNGWEAPGKGVNKVDAIPSALRLGVNFLFYAATHGKISDYKHYIPPDSWRATAIPLSKQAPGVATISATGSEK